MSSLNTLFEQILHSEEKIKLRFEKLKGVNASIHDIEKKIKESEKRSESLQGSFVVKSQRLVQNQLELKWLEKRKEALAKQLKDVHGTKVTLSIEMGNLQHEKENTRKNFTYVTKLFTAKYFLLDENCDDLMKKKIEMKDSNKNKNGIVASDSSREVQDSDVMLQLHNAKTTTLSLTQTRDEVLTKLKTDPTSKRLAKCIDDAKALSLELSRKHSNLRNTLMTTKRHTQLLLQR